MGVDVGGGGCGGWGVEVGRGEGGWCNNAEQHQKCGDKS